VEAQTTLDAYAKTWRHDDIVSSASYATSTNAQYKAEASTLIGWRDSMWQAAESVLAAITAGTVTAPATVAAFIELIPVAPTHPAVA
jgi:hypothetical protein